MKVSFVIPTLNEEEGIGPTLDAVDTRALARKGWQWEFIIVDGASTDATQEEAARRGARIIVEPRRGYGRAYKSGLAVTAGDVVVTADADGTYPLHRAHEVVSRLLSEGLDFITCDRYAEIREGAMTRKHRFGNWILSTNARLLFGIELRDSQSGMWVIRRSALAKLPINDLPDGMAFSQEIKLEAFKRLRRRAREVPGGLAPRIGDAKISSWRDGLANLWHLWHKRFTTRW